MSKRAELRRNEKETTKKKTATYIYTEEQLEQKLEEMAGEKIREKVKEEVDKIRQEVTDEVETEVMSKLLILPMEVLKDHYWPKSYPQMLHKFIDYILEYYDKWEDGELDMEQMKEDLWKYAGIRLEHEKLED